MNRKLIVEKVWIDHHEGYANEPTVHIDFERLGYPNLLTDGIAQVYKLSSNKTIYWAHDPISGLVDFILEDKLNKRGFGGAIMTVITADGDIFNIKGPWSSRSSVINNYFEPHCIEVVCNNGSWYMDIERVNHYIKSLGYQYVRGGTRVSETEYKLERI